MHLPTRTFRRALLALLPVFSPAAATAQESMTNLLAPSQLASQSLRPYWHVFVAYTIAIAFVLGWVVSISKRLRDVERRLGD